MIIFLGVLLIIWLYIHIILKPYVDITKKDAVIIWYTTFRGHRNYIIIKRM